MSTQPYKCEACDVDGVFASARKFPEPGDPTVETDAPTYGVTWRCPGCDAMSLDLCPLGPIEPTKSSCLNCGACPKPGEACPDCGMTPAEIRAFLRIELPRTLEEAESAFDAGLYRHAFAIVDTLLQADDSNARLWESKGTQYQILRLNDAAARCYRRAVALDPTPLIEIALACALNDDKDTVGALEVYDALLAKAEDDQVRAIARSNRGNLHEAAGREDMAIGDYEEAIRLESDRLAHYQNYCRLFTKRKRWAEALAVATRGLESIQGAEKVPLLVEQARAYNEQELSGQGLAASDALLELSPDHPRGLFHRAWALGLAGRLDEAAESLGKLLEIDPGSKDGAKALAKIEAARARAKKPWWKIWG